MTSVKSREILACSDKSLVHTAVQTTENLEHKTQEPIVFTTTGVKEYGFVAKCGWINDSRF